MLAPDLWPLALGAWDALRAHYGPAMAHAAAKEAGLPEGTYFGWMLPALGLAPEPVSARRLAGWAPFTALALNESRLAANARLGLLQHVGADDYVFTEAGRAAAERIIAAAYACMAALHPLSQADLQRLADLLRRLVDASLTAPEPPGKFHLQLSRRTDAAAVPLMARIDQYLTDLNAYRDDAHMAVWLPYGVSGATWEAFTCIWRGQAATLETLSAVLARRGHPVTDYAAALVDLCVRGWLVGVDDRYEVTPTGEAVQQATRETTNRYFFAPWACLDAAKTGELRTLLTALRDGLAEAR